MSILHLPWARRHDQADDHMHGHGPRTAFVLGGGGNLGAIQVGMLQAVIERGIKPDVVIGCSVGALNAAAVAADPTMPGMEKLREIWMSIKDDVIGPAGRLSSIRLLTHRGQSLQPNDGLRRLLQDHLPYQAFEEFPLPLHVVATSLTTGHDRWFSTGPVVEPILASAALPAVFPPVEIDGELLIDGAVVDNVPISRALLLGATRIVVFHVGNFERPRPVPRKPLDVLVQSFSIARNHRFLREVHEPPEGVEMLVLPGVDPGKLRYDDFRHSRRLANQGYAHTTHWLDTLEASAVAVSS
ncbi:MAG TPA: patatin-like phospholipase family protein [Acidimicrobiales bacterium]|jgi:NTE family protein|nr:patatin-like phospholipase family protein [Acidimicrobiales bacterium]